MLPSHFIFDQNFDTAIKYVLEVKVVLSVVVYDSLSETVKN